MKFWIGVTDKSWFDYLAARRPDEVNFWQPGGTSVFRALQPGEPFLFKLHSPLNYIVGGGFFLRHSFLPLSVAWDAFEEKNGTDDLESFQFKIEQFRRQNYQRDPIIGCIVLTTPFFFSEKEWIPAPSNWSRSIVQGKTYSTEEPIGSSVWAEVMKRISIATDGAMISEEQPLYGIEYQTRARLGQGGFRVLVTEAYNRRCAITRERTLPVLEAAHIKPFAKSGPHKISNGLLLRSDLHKLFDLGYMTITNAYAVEVSKRIREEFENGRDYYAMHGSSLNLPSNSLYIPSREYIEWHNQEIYKS